MEEYRYNSTGKLIVKMTYDTYLDVYSYLSTGREATLEEKIALFSGLAMGLVTEYTYQNNQLVTESEDNGANIHYEYDYRGNITKETFSNSSYQQFYYNAAGQLIKTRDPDGYKSEYNYDNNGNVIQKKDHQNNVTNYEYDNRNRLVKEVSALGYTQTFTYDERGNQLSKSVNGVVVERNTYNLDNQILTHTDQYGAVTEHNYDTQGRLVLTTLPSGLVKQYRYDHQYYDRLVEVKYEMGSLARYYYDQYGNVISESDSRGRVNHYLYDGFDRPYQMYDKRWNISNYYYTLLGETVETDQTMTISAKDIKNQIVSEKIIDKETVETIRSREVTYNYLNKVESEMIEYMIGNDVFKTLLKEYEYDNRGNLTEETESYFDEVKVSKTVGYQYDYAGNLVKKTDEAAAVTKSGYNADGFLISTTDALGGIKQYQYDSNRNLIKEINERGFVIEYKYNNKNQLIQVKDPLGYETNFVYNSLNQKLKETNSRGKTIQYSYDEFGNVIEENHNNQFTINNSYYCYDIGESDLVEKRVISNQYEYITRYGYTIHGELTVGSDNFNQTVLVENTYDNHGNLVSKKDGLGNSTAYGYDSLNRLIQTIQPNGTIQEISYDGLGNAVAEKVYDAEHELVKELITTYDGFGQSIAKTTGAKTVYLAYDGTGKIIKETDSLGNEISYTYDLLGRKTKTTYPDGTTIQLEYDLTGNRIASTDQLGNQTKYVYDGKNQLIQEENARGYLKSYSYNSQGQLTDVQDERGSHVYYDYDSYGNLILESINDKNITYSYDAVNRLKKIEYYDDSNEQFSYDLRNNLIEKKGKDGKLIHYTYDDLNRVTEVEYENSNVTKQYDEMDNLIMVTDGVVTEEFSYDCLDQLIEFKQGTESVKYQYDGYGNQTKIIYPDQSEVSYQYDLNDNLVEVIDVNSRVIRYLYNNMNQVVERQITDLPSEYYSYTAAGQIKEIYTPYNEGESKYLLYEYDAAGNLIHYGNRREKYTEGVNQFQNLIHNYHSYLGIENGMELATRIDYEVIEYEYNERDELTKQTKTTSSGSEEAILYSYNIHGDRIEVSQGQLSKVYRYNAKGQLIETSTGSNQINYFYNEQGDVIKEAYGGEQKFYSYDERNKLIGVTDYDKTTIAYGYDVLGNRIKETVQKVNQSPIIINYVNDISRINSEVLSMEKNGISYNFSYGVERLAMNENYYYYDGLGSVTQIVGSSQTILEEYSYTVDGVRNIDYDPYLTDNMYGYRGEAHTYDGLQYLRTRYYDPRLGRFLQWDEYEGKKKKPKSKNRYGYGENNPNRYRDPSGRYAIGSGTNRKPVFVDGKLGTYDRGKFYLYTGNYNGLQYRNGIVVRKQPEKDRIEQVIQQKKEDSRNPLQPIKDLVNDIVNLIKEISIKVPEKRIELPEEIALWLNQGIITESEIKYTGDGMMVIDKDLRHIIMDYKAKYPEGEDFETFLEKNRDFLWKLDGWYLYCVTSGDVYEYSLTRMRTSSLDTIQGVYEQAFLNQEVGFSLSFITLESGLLDNPENLLNSKKVEVVQRETTEHGSGFLDSYFKEVTSEGYAMLYYLYSDKIAAEQNQLAGIYGDSRFTKDPIITGNQLYSQETIYADDEKIYNLVKYTVNDVNALSIEERNALIYLRTENPDYYAFQGEGIFHASFYNEATMQTLNPITGRAELQYSFLQGQINQSASVSDQGVGENDGLESLYYGIFNSNRGDMYGSVYDYWSTRIGGYRYNVYE